MFCFYYKYSEKFPKNFFLENGVKSDFRDFFRKNFSLAIVPRPTSRKNPYIIGDTEGREGRGILPPPTYTPNVSIRFGLFATPQNLVR
jgi:hypothetical protein